MNFLGDSRLWHTLLAALICNLESFVIYLLNKIFLEFFFDNAPRSMKLAMAVVIRTPAACAYGTFWLPEPMKWSEDSWQILKNNVEH